jgi:hypothetical protein
VTTVARQLKTIVYPAGGKLRVRFRVPEAWVENYDERADALFYPEPPSGREPWPVGGWLYVSVGRSVAGRQLGQGDVRRLLPYGGALRKGVVLTTSQSGAWVHYSKKVRKLRAHTQVDHAWWMMRAGPRKTIDQALFVFSGVADLHDAPDGKYRGPMRVLAREMLKADFDDG